MFHNNEREQVHESLRNFVGTFFQIAAAIFFVIILVISIKYLTNLEYETTESEIVFQNIENNFPKHFIPSSRMRLSFEDIKNYEEVSINELLALRVENWQTITDTTTYMHLFYSENPNLWYMYFIEQTETGVAQYTYRWAKMPVEFEGGVPEEISSANPLSYQYWLEKKENVLYVVFQWQKTKE